MAHFEYPYGFSQDVPRSGHTCRKSDLAFVSDLRRSRCSLSGVSGVLRHISKRRSGQRSASIYVKPSSLTIVLSSPASIHTLSINVFNLFCSLTMSFMVQACAPCCNGAEVFPNLLIVLRALEQSARRSASVLDSGPLPDNLLLP
jgi:hypothetical protein